MELEALKGNHTLTLPHPAPLHQVEREFTLTLILSRQGRGDLDKLVLPPLEGGSLDYDQPVVDYHAGNYLAILIHQVSLGNGEVISA